jgi:hypothetical protein
VLADSENSSPPPPGGAVHRRCGESVVARKSPGGRRRSSRTSFPRDPHPNWVVCCYTLRMSLHKVSFL